MPKRGGTRPAEGMVTLPLLPVQPRSRTMLGKQDRGKVRDFYTQAKRENNLLESTYHVQARIGFKRSCTPSAIRLRPLDMLKALPPKADPGGNRLPGMPESPLFSQTTPLAAPPAEPISEEAISAAAAAPAAKAELGWLREQACGLLIQAGEDGTLATVLGNIRNEAGEGGAAQGGAAGADEVEEEEVESRQPSLKIAAGLAREISLIAVEEVVKQAGLEREPSLSPRSVLED